MPLPILYSFRRCPYAMRARLAIAASGVGCELREVVLRDKPPDLLAASFKATVPVLVNPPQIIEESLDIMLWALNRNDPFGWLAADAEMGADLWRLIEEADGGFKTSLDRYKYASRYDGAVPQAERDKAAEFLAGLDQRLANNRYLTGETESLADMAILPFVRQFSLVDKDWFDARPWPCLHIWLARFLQSELFASVMRKYPKWRAGDPVTRFPAV
ncbi:MAG: glutathione S-transferase [Rhodobacteraceae bacterium]|nr:glutathione S-transferase [Paracoccaceae bacterium]